MQELPRAGQTLCTFLYANGGNVVLGVTADSRLLGQTVRAKTRIDLESCKEQNRL